MFSGFEAAWVRMNSQTAARWRVQSRPHQESTHVAAGKARAGVRSTGRRRRIRLAGKPLTGS